MGKYKKILNFILFISLAAFLFVKLSYLFANSGLNRDRIVGIKEEDNIDVVYIGGSAAIDYWDTMKAWKDYGITSYLYATTGIQSESVKPYMIEVQKSVTPKLFIIDARTFTYWHGLIDEPSIRKGSDSMDVSLNRFEFVNKAIKFRKWQESYDDMYQQGMRVMPLYMRIMYYHSNYEEVLPNEDNWKLIDNEQCAKYNGFELLSNHSFLNQPNGYETDTENSLPEGAEKVFLEALDYCEEEGLEVLFVISPYAVGQGGQAEYNAIEDEIRSRGFGFLDCNRYFEDIGLDYYSDFQDINHVNICGAEKYTDYLSKYILANYSGITDHREDKTSSEWELEYSVYSDELQHAIDEVNSSIKKKEQVEDKIANMQNCDVLGDWLDIADDDCFEIALAGKGDWKSIGGSISEVFSRHGIVISDEGNYLAYIHNWENGSRYIQEEESNEVFLFGNAATNLGTISMIRFDQEGNIFIDDKNYSLVDDKINAVVFDKNNNSIIDVVSFEEITDNGIIRVEHHKAR